MVGKGGQRKNMVKENFVMPEECGHITEKVGSDLEVGGGGFFTTTI